MRSSEPVNFTFNPGDILLNRQALYVIGRNNLSEPKEIQSSSMRSCLILNPSCSRFIKKVTR